MTTHDFSGQVAFITGGSSGIGLATAHALVRAGARVAIASRDERAAQPAMTRLVADAGSDAVRFIACDVRQDVSVARAVALASEHFGRLDLAFNCAGVGADLAPLERTDQAVWDDVMATNARGVWLAMRYEIPAILASGGGSIVNMSSIYGAAGRAANHPHTASKHAVLGMTRSVALEYAARGVRINAICAGATATPSMLRAQQVVPEVVQTLIDEHPMRRLASEEEIASTVLWLCSRGAGFVTGAAISVDGGFLAA